MIGGTGTDVLNGAATNDIFDIDFRQNPNASSAVETIYVRSATGSLYVNGTLAGGLLTQSGPKTWTDGQYQYQFVPAAAVSPADLHGTSFGSLDSGPGIGELKITSVLTGAAFGTIDLLGFNLTSAESSGGFLGFSLAPTIFLNASANAGVDPPPPSFQEGSQQSYTLSVDAPSSVARTFTVTLSGAIPSDFEAEAGDTIEQLSAAGTFSVVLGAGANSVSFALIDATADNGSSDIATGATLTLGASLPNPFGGNAVQAGSLTFNYVPGSPDTTRAPNPGDVITGQIEGELTVYNGDGGDDSIVATGAKDLINAQNSGNDSIIGGGGTNTVNGSAGDNVISVSGTADQVNLGTGYNTLYGGSGHDTIGSANGDDLVYVNGGTDLVLLGDGNNQVYADGATSYAQALAGIGTGTATGVQGNLISVLDGDNTIAGGNGNEFVSAGTGNDVVLLGAGNDTFLGGIEVTGASANWSTSPVVIDGSNVLQLNGIDANWEGYTNPFPQPYNGNEEFGTNTPVAIGNETVFGGSGNELIELANGNSYVEAGSGSTTIQAGMGSDTIFAGSGADLIEGGGGSEYVYGGSGASVIDGGDGNNTIIGGSGNATLAAALGPNGNLDYAGANLEQNYVTGGSGNDVIYGSAGSDTLIAGTGNTTIYGQTGNELMEGGSGNDVLIAGPGSATIMAGSGSDTLQGGSGGTSTYLIYGGSGSDSINGGAGTDVIYAGDGGTASNPTHINADLDPGDDTAPTTIYGGAGVDQIQGGAGTALIYAGDGGVAGSPTTVIAGSGSTTLYGGLGTDALQGGSGTDVLYAGDGGTAEAPSTVIAGTGVSTLYGGAGDAVMEDLQSGQDLLVSATADDTLFGSGADTLVAGTGDDALHADSGSVTFVLDTGSGNNTIYTEGGTENLVFGTGVAPADLTGGFSRDDAGNWYLDLSGDGVQIGAEDALTGSLGAADFTDSGTVALPTLLEDAFGGVDQVVPVGSENFFLTLGNNESLVAGSYYDTISSWGVGDSISGGTNFFGDVIYSAGTSANIQSGTGSDTITAAGDNSSITDWTGDHITVSGANSTLLSQVGGDSITASGNNDTLVAGAGTSTFFVNNPSTVIEVTAAGGADSIFSSVSYSAPANVNSLTLTGSAGIAATGNSGNDTLTGSAGADTLTAGAGLATLLGGAGNTTFVLNNTLDVVQDTHATASNQIQSSVSFSLPTNVNTLELIGTANLIGAANSGTDTLVSNSGIDTLVGGSGNDTFVINNPNDVIETGSGTVTIVVPSGTGYGPSGGTYELVLTGTANLTGTAGSGNDTLVSNSGVDTLYGGSGNDTFIVNNPSDVVQDTATSANNLLESSVSVTLPSNVNTLTLIGTASIAGTGNTASDVITSNAGDSTLVAGAAADTLVGSAGNTTFVVNNSGDVVQQSATGTSSQIQSSVSYSLVANVNTLVLTGPSNLTGAANSANDTLVANAGVDTLVGGAGNDTFVVNNVSDIVQDTSSTATNTVQSSVSYSLPTNVNVLALTGAGNLVATANSGPDSLVGNSGQDTLLAGTGLDTLVAGSGVATLVGGSGRDLFVLNNSADVVSVTGSHGADTIQSTVSYTLPAAVTVLELSGTAALVGAAVSGDNTLIAGAGSDTLYAGSGFDTLIAGTGSDTLYAGSGFDTLIAGTGVDTLVGGGAADTFVINNTADVLQNISSGSTVFSSVSYTMAANVATLTLFGSADLVGIGNTGTNTISANSGDDTLIAGTGPTELLGGLGSDLFVIDNTADIVSEPDYGQKGGTDTIQSSVGYTLPSTVDVLLLTGSANLAAAGNAHADSIVGNAGQDTLAAGTGNDTLVAGSGLATLIGSTGNDTFVIDNTGDEVHDSVAGHDNVLISSVSCTLPTDVDTLLLTGSANLEATGNADNDSITGNAGADTLTAGVGNDTLVAGSGLVTFVGGSGNDIFIVNSSMDIIQAASSSSQNVVFASSSFTLPNNVNVLTLTGIAGDVGTGNSGNDSLFGGPGSDTLVAGSGVDSLIGGSGSTTFVVNNASDVVVDSSTTVSNAVQASVSYSLPTNVNTLVLSGANDLSGIANGAADTLVADGLADTLFGGAGNDTFVVTDTSDVVQDTVTSANNTLQSAVNYSLPTNVNTLVLTGTENLQGSANSGADTLVSNGGVDTLTGGAGNDTFVISNTGDVVLDTSSGVSNVIQSSVSYSLPVNVNALVLTGSASLVATGNGAANVLTANGANDTLVAGTGVATLIGGSGNDVFVVDSTNDVVDGTGSGAGSLIQSSVNYSLPSSVNDLVLTGTSGLIGTANSGNDTLVSNSSADTLKAGSGADLLVVNNAADVLQNLTANDTIEAFVNFALPGVASELLLGGTAALSGTGGGGAETLVAGAGSDTLVAGAGLATLVGGAGNDTFVVDNTGDVVQDANGGGTNAVLASVSYTLPQDVDSLTLTGTAGLTATGNTDLSNVITANSGADLIIGASLQDTLNGGTGSDTIDAGPGVNLINAGNGGIATKPTIVFGNAAATSADTESTIYGGSGVDLLYGGPGFDAIYTGSGTETAFGGSGFDTLFGASGTNTLYGGSGSTVIYGGNATAMIYGGSGSNLIYVGNGATAEVGSIVNGSSSSTQTTIYGGSGADELEGDAGSDLIFGGSGVDTLVTGSGSDSLYGGSGGGQLIDNLSAGHSLLVGGGGAETLSGYGGDTLAAGTGADLMYDRFGTVTGSVYEFNLGFGQTTLGNGSGDNDTAASSFNDTISFGAGISASALTIEQGDAGADFSLFNPSLVINDGSSAITVDGGFVPGVINSVSFANSGSESFTQLMQAQGPGTVSLREGSLISELSTDSGETLINDQGLSNWVLWAFGNDDLITDQKSNDPEAIFAYGNADTITGYSVWAGGADDLVTVSGEAGFGGEAVATLAGSNDTLSFVGGNGAFQVDQSSDVIQIAAPVGFDTLDALASYTLPTNVQMMTLDSAVGGITGTSNAQGGVLTAAGAADTLFGGSGADTLIAQGNFDVLVGGSGPDMFELTSSTQTIQFGTGSPALDSVQTNSSYTLGGGANTLTETGAFAVAVGNSANDLITAIGSSDTLVAGSGNDTLVDGSSSPVTMVGGSGSDTFVITKTGDVIRDTASTGSNVVESSVSYTLPTLINTLILTGSGNLSAVANGSNDVLVGNSGNDTLVAGSGNDTLMAGSGADTFVLNSGFGNEVISNVNSGDVIQFGAGISQSSLTFTAIPGSGGTAPSLVISGTGGSVTVQGGLVPGAVGAVKFTGGASNTIPQLVAPSGDVTVPGSGGNLILSPSSGDSVTGGSGQDTVVAWGSNDTLDAGSGGAVIYAGGTADLVTGSAANDTLTAIGASDTLVAGSGIETFAVDNSSAVIQVTGTPNQDSVVAAVNYTLPPNVLSLSLAGSANLQATGNSGNDTLIANSGNDTLVSGTGIDTLVGGTGADTFIVNNATDVIEPSGNVAQDVVQAAVTYTLPSTFTTLQLIGTGGISGTANSGVDTLIDLGGNDTLVAGSGIDTLVAGSGTTLVGGAGPDYLQGGGRTSNVFVTGTGVDTIVTAVGSTSNQIYLNNAADVLYTLVNVGLFTSVSYTLPAGVTLPTHAIGWALTGTANIAAVDDDPSSFGLTLTGNSGNDTLVAGSASGTVNITATNGNNILEGGADSFNTLEAGSGNNLLEGGAFSNNTMSAGGGVDTFIGGAADTDVIYVNNGADVVEAQPGSNDSVFSAASYTLPANVTYLALRSAGIVATGNSMNGDTLRSFTADTLIAGTGNESLSSGGNTTIVAGTGVDTIAPWENGDVLIFNSGFGGALVQKPAFAITGPTVEFGAGISAGEVTVAPVLGPSGSAALQIMTGGGEITLDGALSGSPYQFAFNGGSTQSLLQFLGEVNVQSGTVSGGSGNAILQAGSSLSVTGGAGNDSIYVTGVADTLYGGSGNQLLNAAGADDVIEGGSGQYTVNGYGASDTVISGTGSDSISLYGSDDVLTSESNASSGIRGYAYGNAESLVGGAGNDTLWALNSSLSIGTQDTLVAGSGATQTLVSENDVGGTTFVINSTGDTVQEVFSGFSDTLVSSVSYSLPTNVDTLVLSGSGNLVGTANSDNALLIGNAGLDTLNAGTGTDTLIAGSGVVVMNGGTHVNLFVVNNTGDTVVVGATHGADTIQSSVSYSLPANVGTLILTGSADVAGTGNTLSNVIVANSGNDTLTAGTTNTTLEGGAGNDIFVISSTKDIVQDTFNTGSNLVMSSISYTLPANVTALTLTGTFALSATGTTADDVLTANSGKDTLTASGDAATLFGGTGNDLFVISSADDVIQVTATGLADTISSSVSYSLPANVSRLAFSGSGNVTGYGGAQNDTLSANSGSDTLIAGTGAASLVAGTGNDLFVINSTSDAVSVGATHGVDTIQSSVNFSLPTTVAMLTLTGTAALSGTASSSASVINANSGNDTLTAIGTAATTLVGGAGSDTFVISAAADVVQDTSSLSSNILRSSVSYTLPTNVNTLVFTGTTALVATANGGNDSLVANTGSDTLTAAGLGGNDTLVAQTSGTDHLVGGTGNEVFVVANTADVVSDTSSTASNTIQSSVNYALPTNVNTLILTGTAALKGTANTANDTLVSNRGLATLVGGTLSSSNDLFVINNSLDVITLSATHGTETIQSSVSYSLPTTINNLVLAGTVALKGTANSGNDSIVSADSFNDTLVALAGTDTLVAGVSGTDSLVGGTGNDTFVVNNASDVVTDTSTTATNVLDASVSYTLPTNVNTMVLTGTAALVGTGNAHADTITGNSGADTLVAGSGLATLIGGIGTDTFVVDNTGDVVSVTGSGTNDVIQSSVNYTLPTNVQYLTLTGTAALKGTGNSLTDLIVGNTGNDTLTGGSGIAVLEGGRTAGSDVLTATGNQAALIPGAGASTLTGGAFKDFLAAGLVSDSITTGATANVVAVNSGDGATTLQPTSGASDVLSLGAGIDTENLTFTKSGNNLILQDGVTGDSTTFTNWYLGASDQNVTTLQVVEIASASYDGSGSDPLRNEALEEFNFTSLVSQFNTAGSPTNWALSNGMPTAQLSSSATEAYGGDLAYYYGLNGNLTGMNLSAAQSTLTNASFATGTQTIDSWSSISGGGGGGGLELLARPSGGVNRTPADAPSTTGISAASAGLASTVVSPAILTAALQPSDADPVAPAARTSPLRPLESTPAGNTSGPATHAAPPVTASLAVPAFLDPVRMGWIDVDRMGDAVPGAAGASEPGPDPEMLGSALALAGVAPVTARRAVSGGPGRFDLMRVQID